jgi:hypothetical protein
MFTTEEALPAFFEAAELVAGLLANDAVAQSWSKPSVLAGMSVGGVAAHLYLGARRLEVVLDQELPEAAKVADLVAFYGANRVDDPRELSTGLSRYIRDEGEERSARYGPAGVHRRFVDLVTRLRSRLPAEPPDRMVSVVQVPDGVTPLGGYLASRVVELVVHSDDLATSAQLPPLSLPRSAASMVIDTMVELVRGRSGDLEVIRALARRERAKDGVLRAF